MRAENLCAAGRTVAMCLLVALSAFGQSQNATLDGQVKDPSGAAIVGADVTVSSTEQQFTVSVKSDSGGRFAFPNLAPGTYNLTIAAPGFQTSEQKGIQLLANQSATADTTLKVGDSATRIEVTADVALLNTDNGSKQEGVPPQIVNQLPLEVTAGTPRNAVQFISFLPGVNTGTSPQAFNSRINGGLKMGDEAIMDGVSMQEGTMSQSGMVAFFDFAQTPDMVSEVRVLTSSYEPEYGTTTGGEIIVTTRSGTDTFHGGGYEYVRNKDFNATQWLNNRPPGDQRPKDNENEYGAFIGGPVKIPHVPFVFGAKHKTYFFFDAEFLRSLGGTSRSLVSIPSQAERQGDFSDLLPYGIHLYDPRNGNAPYPNNQIPRYEWDPLAVKWMQYLPTPTSPGPFNNYLEPPVSDGILSNLDEFLYKIDHYWGEPDHIAATIWRQKTQPNNQCGLPVQLCTSSPANPEDAWVSRLNWDHIFSPTRLNHFALGYLNRNEGYGSVPGQNPATLPQIPNAIAYTASPAASFNGVSGFSNFPSWGNTAGPGPLNKTTRPTYIANDLVTWVHGPHEIKFGGEFRHVQQVWRQNGGQSGSVNFAPTETGNPSDALSGDPYASLLIGAVNNGSLSAHNIAHYGALQRAYSWFVGDTWKMTSNFTINYGLRWDRFSPTWETSDNLTFLTFAPNPGAGGIPGSLGYAGTKWGSASAGVRYPETAWNGAYAPRIGIAYKLDEKTVVRAGYGLFYTQAFYPAWGGGMSQDGLNPQIAFGAKNNGYQPAFYLQNGFPAYSTAPTVSVTADNGTNGPLYRPTYANHLSNTQQWNLTIERKFGSSSVGSIAYVGNKGTHLPSQLQPLNYINPALLQTMGTVELDSVFQPGQTSLFGVRAPYPGWAAQLDSVGACQPTVAQALVAMPQFCGGLFGLNENEGTSEYNALQTKLEKQFSAGLYLGANYTFSKLLTDASSSTQATANYGGIGGVISPYQGSRNKSLSPDDITHTFALMGVYNLPFGTGKRWLSGNRFENGVFGGWVISSSVKLTSGMPFYFRSGECNNVFAPSGTNGSLPYQLEAACIPAILPGMQDKVLLQSWGSINVNKPIFNAAAFESPAVFSQGTYLGQGQRVTDVRGSPYRDVNLSLSKKFNVTERLHMEFRAETFNVFNNHYFTCDGQAFGDCIPFNNDPLSPSFGVWNGTVTQPRNIQLVGRVTF